MQSIADSRIVLEKVLLLLLMILFSFRQAVRKLLKLVITEPISKTNSQYSIIHNLQKV